MMEIYEIHLENVLWLSIKILFKEILKKLYQGNSRLAVNPIRGLSSHHLGTFRPKSTEKREHSHNLFLGKFSE